MPCAAAPGPAGARRDGTSGRVPTDISGHRRTAPTASALPSCIGETSERKPVRWTLQPRLNGAVTSPETVVVEEPSTDEVVSEDRPWIVIVWNDPINLMSYVTFVLQKLFGYSLEKATEMMLDVNHKGKAVVASDTRERSEMHVFRLHEHCLLATLEHDE